MKIFLLDIWHDLRAKRLWPVALLLAAALVAVPVVLSKSSETPPAPAPDTSVKAEAAEKSELAALAEVKLAEADDPRGSTLGVFNPDDPFLPPKLIAKRSRPGASSAGSTIESKVADSDSTGGGGTSASTAPSTGGSDSPSTGGGHTGGGTPNTGGGDGGGQTTTAYKYVVDVTFSSNGRTRRLNGLEKLDMLPNQASPLLIFMGVTPKGSDAVFLVDSTLTAAGEGRCQPSPDECAFAVIGAGSEHVFTDEDGDTYELRIDEIRKVEIGARASKSSKGATADAAVGPRRRFVPPVLADLVVVASNSTEDSNRDSDRR